MKYCIITHEEQRYRYHYEVEANNKEEAKEKVLTGNIEPLNSKMVSSETVDIEVEEKK